jgi:protein TonB
MFQSGTGQQARGVIRHGIQATGTWLGCMGIFTGLLWLSSLMPAKPSVEEPPAERAPKAPPPSSPPQEEKPEPFGTEAVLDLPTVYPEPSCPSPSDTHEEVIPFGMGMTRPELLSSAPLVHTPEALSARVQGLMIAKCTVTCLGEVKDCRILKSLPHMDQAALAALASRRYKPVYYLGRPITVSYVFVLRLQLPENPSGLRPPRRTRSPVIPAPKPKAPLSAHR